MRNAVGVVFEGVLISTGRTDYLLMGSAFVNIVYYGVIYALFLMGVFSASMDFVIMLFGFGIVIAVMFDIVFYLRSKSRIPGWAGQVPEDPSARKGDDKGNQTG